MSASRISIIVTTFNSPDALRWVLGALANQTLLPVEVIVADDGSVTETREIIDQLRCSFPCRLFHSWQADSGFRLSRSRNLAVLKATGDWLIFLDGDCVMPENFLSIHQKIISQNCLINCSRKLLSREITGQLISSDFYKLALTRYCSGRKFLSLPLGFLRDYPVRSWRLLRGFFISVDRILFDKIAGFDEAYSSWGLEDSDFAVRALRAGGRLRDGRYSGAVLHLWHSENGDGPSPSNACKFQSLLMSKRQEPMCSLYLEESESVQ